MTPSHPWQARAPPLPHRPRALVGTATWLDGAAVVEEARDAQTNANALPRRRFHWAGNVRLLPPPKLAPLPHRPRALVGAVLGLEWAAVIGEVRDAPGGVGLPGADANIVETNLMKAS